MIYDLALACFLPKLLFQKKYRKNFLQRLGVNFPKIEKNGRKLLWLHAVSVGETKAVAALAAQIKGEFPDLLMIVSSVTETGHCEAKRSIPFADWHVYLPFDISWVIRPILRRAAPDYVLISETDLWRNFLKIAKEQGAKIALVNGKLSERSGRNYRRLSLGSRYIWPGIDLFCVQNDPYRQRFEQAGVANDRMVLTGNIKHDRKLQLLDDIAGWKGKLGIEAQVLLLSCTHDPEERILLEALQELWRQFPKLKVLLAPRHPERFDEVAQLIQSFHIPFQRFSLLKNGGERLVLIDRMGMLDPCYQLADLALIGGSFTPKVGGHNILEPCGYGTPVLFGPFMHAQPEMVQWVNEYKAGRQITAEQIVEVISGLLGDEAERFLLSKAALKMMGECRGATNRTFLLIKSLWQIGASAIV